MFLYSISSSYLSGCLTSMRAQDPGHGVCCWYGYMFPVIVVFEVGPVESVSEMAMLFLLVLSFCSEETRCRFCHAVLPDWRPALTPTQLKPTASVMSVRYRGVTYRITYTPGPDGLQHFLETLQSIGIKVATASQVTFLCRSPDTGDHSARIECFMRKNRLKGRLSSGLDCAFMSKAAGIRLIVLLNNL